VKRWDALGAIASAYPREPIVVTLGGTAREMAAFHRAPNHLYVLDSMGLPPALGLGLALGLEDSSFEKVVVVEGDGSLLMGLSVLATIGLTRPSKLVLLVLDNGVYAATGSQATAVAAVDLCAMARACGLEAREVNDLESLRSALAWTRESPGPLFVRARISPEQAKTPYLLEDPVVLGHTFAQYVREHR
jgi:sulfopyruvate decarboxylase subunit beta